MFCVAALRPRHRALLARLAARAPIAGGLLFYFVYVYLQYATSVAFNSLFLVYVATFALSAVTFFLNLRSIEVSRLATHISAHFPRRLFTSFTLVMSTALTVLWVGGRIIPSTLAGRFPDEFAGMTTLVSQALDLGMVVPLLLSTAVLLWQRSAWSYLLAGISMTFGFMMSITLPTWTAVPLVQSGQINLIEAAPFVLLCLVGLSIAGRLFWCVRSAGRSSRRDPLTRSLNR